MPGTADRADYHLIAFETTVEASAFVAALSRYLNSPLHTAYVERSGPGAVLARAGTPSGGVELYLSDSTLKAASVAFPPVPVSGTLGRDALPADCAPVIGAEPPPAWGMTDAEQRINALLGTATRA